MLYILENVLYDQHSALSHKLNRGRFPTAKPPANFQERHLRGWRVRSHGDSTLSLQGDQHFALWRPAGIKHPGKAIDHGRFCSPEIRPVGALPKDCTQYRACAEASSTIDGVSSRPLRLLRDVRQQLITYLNAIITHLPDWFLADVTPTGKHCQSRYSEFLSFSGGTDCLIRGTFLVLPFAQ